MRAELAMALCSQGGIWEMWWQNDTSMGNGGAKSLDYQSGSRKHWHSFLCLKTPIFVWISFRFVWCRIRKAVQKFITSLGEGQEVMTKNQGRENHSELFANDCYKKCNSVGEILQGDWLYKLNLLMTKDKWKIYCRKVWISNGMYVLDCSKALDTNLCLLQGQEPGNTQQKLFLGVNIVFFSE